jgi:hypothetical protein
MDTSHANCLRLHKQDGKTFEFYPSSNGLYRLEVDSLRDAINMWTLISTVHNNARVYTKRAQAGAQLARKMTAQAGAQLARKMQNIIMHPGDQQLSTINIRHLRNCPVTSNDIRTATDIYGPNLGSLKGKTVHRPSPHVRIGCDPIPREIYDRHHNVTLAIDIFFVNKIPFLLTVSRNIKFVTVEALPDRQEPTILRKLRAVRKLYHQRGFAITSILADNEFEPLRPFFPQLNVCGAGEHVPEAERMIRTVKDRTRSTLTLLPYRWLPRLVVIHLVRNAVLWLNAFPSADSVSTEHSPRYLLTGRELTYDKHVRIEFGAYAQTHEEHTNDMGHRTMGAICLGPTGNAQGGHWFLCLTSGARVIRHKWTELPMPDDARHRVNQIGRQQGMAPTVTFSNRRGLEIMDAFRDYQLRPDDQSDSDSDDDDYSYSSDDDDDPDTDDDREVFATRGQNDLDPIGAAHDDYDDDVSSSDNDSSSNDDHDPPATPPPQGPIIAITPHGATDDSTGVNDADDELVFTSDDDMARTSASDDGNTGVEDMEDDLSQESTGVHNLQDDLSQESTGVQDHESTGVQEPVTEYEAFQNASEYGRRAAHQQPTPERRTRAHTEPDDGVYLYLTVLIDTLDPDDELFTLVTAQLTANKGLKVFGEAGETAIGKELEQLLERRVMHGVPHKSLTFDQRRAALRYLMFLK